MPHARIAIAGESRILRGLRRAALSPIPATVDEAGSGWELLWLLAEHDPYDLVIAGGDLPFPSGAQVLAMARTAGIRTPFLLVSSRPDERARSVAGRVERAALVQDRSDPGALLDAARRLLSSSSGTSPEPGLIMAARPSRLRSVP